MKIVGIPQASLLPQVTLHGVAQHRRVTWSYLRIDAEHVAKDLARVRVVELPRRVQDAEVTAARGGQLADLLLERHPLQQVFDTLFDRQVRVAVIGSGSLSHSVPEVYRQDDEDIEIMHV
jgi:hypothetical protein